MLLHHATPHRKNPLLLRLGVVIRATLAVCVAGLIAIAQWYVVAIALPAYNSAREQHAFESAEGQFLVARVGQIQTFIHFH